MQAVYRTLWLTIILIVAAHFGSSCNSGGNPGLTLSRSNELTAPAMPDLPPPSELAGELDLPRTTSYADEDLFHKGRDFNVLLPNQRVTALADAAGFNGDWSAGQGTSGLPYCIYSFVVPDFDREPELHYDWLTPPGDPGAVYFGVARWNDDSWAWFQGSADNAAYPATLAPYFDETGLLLLVVAVASAEVTELAWVNLGPPNVVPKLHLSVERGVMPLDIVLDASNSECTIGTIIKYEWDWDGDGTYDLNSGLDDIVEHDYSSWGSYTPRLRITTSHGIRKTSSRPLEVVAPWATSWGGADSDEFNDIEISNDGYVYCAGRTASYGQGHNDALLVKYDMDGNLIWAKAWGGYGSDIIIDICTAYGDSICAVGSTWSFGEGQSDIFVQNWGSDGELNWSRSIGRSGADFGAGIDFYMEGITGAIYACGYSTGAGLGDRDAVLVKFDLLGDDQWAVHFSGSGSDAAGAVLVTKFLFNPEEIWVGGRYNDAGDPKVVVAQFDPGGTMQQAKTFSGWTTYSECNDMIFEKSIETTLWLTGYMHNGLGGGEAYVLEYSTSATPIARRIAGADTDNYHGTGICWDGGRLEISGFCDGQGAYERGAVFTMDTAGVLYNSAKYGNDVSEARLNAIVSFPYSGIMAAGTASSAFAAIWGAFSPTNKPFAGVWEDTAIESGNAQVVISSLDGSADTVDIVSATLDSGGGGIDAVMFAKHSP